MTDSNIAVVKGVYDAMAQGDPEALFANFAPEIDWREADGFPYSDRNPYRTPGEVAEGLLSRLGGEWDGFAAVPEHFAADDGELVVVLGRYQGTYKATGKAIDVPMAHAWTVRDGQIVAFRQYTDTALVRDALD